ncbi:MAG: hypothetical protein IK084_06085 [Bacteroidaceae bacterium]|nr:hypothetical protein [Bacteroidaceae bacterium]
MIDTAAIYAYIGTIKHEPYGDLREYRLLLTNAEITFRSALTQCAIEKEGKGLILIQRDFEDTLLPLQEELDRALKGKDSEPVKWLSLQVKKTEEALEYLKRVRSDIEAGGNGEHESEKVAAVKPTEPNRFCKALEDYGELLSVKDLTEIFGCSSRTITNWEASGLIVNVAETSDEINAIGRRKRGQEKRYRKEAILRSIALQEKYNDKG